MNGSISHIIFVNLKKEKEKDRALMSIFKSFLGKLGKGKGYVPIERTSPTIKIGYFMA